MSGPPWFRTEKIGADIWDAQESLKEPHDYPELLRAACSVAHAVHDGVRFLTPPRLRQKIAWLRSRSTQRRRTRRSPRLSEQRSQRRIYFLSRPHVSHSSKRPKRQADQTPKRHQIQRPSRNVRRHNLQLWVPPYGHRFFPPDQSWRKVA